MSRLTDLIARARVKDRAFGYELERQFRALASGREGAARVGERLKDAAVASCDTATLTGD